MHSLIANFTGWEQPLDVHGSLKASFVYQIKRENLLI